MSTDVTTTEGEDTPSLLDRLDDGEVYEIEREIDTPIQCTLCGKGFDNRIGARNHVTNSTSDPKHRGRRGDEPGVINFSDEVLESIQVPSDDAHNGTITYDIDLDKLFADSDSESDSEKDEDAEEEPERFSIKRGNRSYNGTALDESGSPGAQTIKDRPIKEPSGVKRNAIADPDTDDWMRFVEPSDYTVPDEYSIEYRDPVWLRLHLAGGYSVTELADSMNVSERTIYGHISDAESIEGTIAAKKRSVMAVWRDENLPRPYRLSPESLEESEAESEPVPSESDIASESYPEPDPPLESETIPVGAPVSLDDTAEYTVSLSEEAVFALLSSDADESARRELFEQVLGSSSATDS